MEAVFAYVLIDLVVQRPDVAALIDCSPIVCFALSPEPFLLFRRGGFDDGPERHVLDTGVLQ